jgi:hypothetical protein
MGSRSERVEGGKEVRLPQRERVKMDMEGQEKRFGANTASRT